LDVEALDLSSVQEHLLQERLETTDNGGLQGQVQGEQQLCSADEAMLQAASDTW
jgi:hypothetical protein